MAVSSGRSLSDALVRDLARTPLEPGSGMAHILPVYNCDVKDLPRATHEEKAMPHIVVEYSDGDHA